MRPFWFLVGMGIATVLLLGTGVLWALHPTLFVRLLRRVAMGDYYLRTQEFEKSMVSVEGRIAGLLFLCFGLLFLYYFMIIII